MTVDGGRFTVNGWRTAVVVVGVFAARANAQSLRGIVLYPDTTTRAAGVIVAASDAQGSVVARALSGDEGSFELKLPSAGKYALRLLRVGYRPTVIADVEVPVSGRDAMRLVLGGEAVMLSAVTVKSDNVCGSTQDAGRAVAQLWEEARTALTATELSIGAGTLTAQWQSFQYSMDRGGNRATEMMVLPRSGANERPFVSVGADSLARDGYIIRDRGDMVYRAPDAPALLSNTFAATHCFNVEPPSRARPHWVGVAFRPIPARGGVKDITGTLWLDRATSELRLLEFRYTNQPPEANYDIVGGYVEFARMPTGHWLISRWAIRTPRLVQRTVGGGGVPGGGSQTQLVLSTITVTGGELLSVNKQRDVLYQADMSLVATEGGSRVATAQPSACGAMLKPGLMLAGTVADSSRPAPGALVNVKWTDAALRTTSLTAVSDPRGTFSIPCVAKAVPLTISAALGERRAQPLEMPATTRAVVSVDIDFGSVATRRP